jgi:hypothetical protein
MKNKTIIMFICILILSGCVKTNTSHSEDIKTVQTNEPDADTKPETVDQASATAISQTEAENYEGYSGLWTESSFSHEEVLSYGGLEFSFQVTDKTNLDGCLFMQQGTTERIAEIDNITGKITNGELNYKYDDDGWGGSGILHITFSNDNTIQIEVQDYKIKDTNLSGYGFSGTYKLERTRQNEEEDGEKSSVATANKTTEPDLFDVIYEKYYANWTDSEMQNAIAERKQYRDQCSIYPEVANYLENVREVRDISSVVEPLYFTDLKIYQKQDFDQVPPLIIHLAKNEIYARHGYIFKNEDLNNYFKGQIWYEPSITPENFKDSLFNKNEQVNLKLLSSLDTYK